MLFKKKINGSRINSYSDIRRDVAITSPLIELPTNLGNLSFVEKTSSLHHPGLIAVNPEFDWAKNTNPFQRIRHLLTLEDNWDGYGAARFSRPHIKRALELYSSIYEYYLAQKIDFSQKAPFIAPCSNGSILFEWVGKRFPDRELEIFVRSAMECPLEYLKSAEDLEEEESFSIGETVSLLNWLFAAES
jgi:hypothetical protein